MGLIQAGKLVMTHARVRACVRACGRVCVCAACVRACVRVCVCACVRACFACVREYVQIVGCMYFTFLCACERRCACVCMRTCNNPLIRVHFLDDGCFSNPCQHDGNCSNFDNDTYQCQCNSTYTGTTCETCM